MIDTTYCWYRYFWINGLVLFGVFQYGNKSVFFRAEKIAVIFLAHRKISIANPGWSDGRIVTFTLSIVSLHANY
jgi:hypothetical protein